MKSSIDITKLEKVRRTASKITARCPACAATGGDKAGVHLFINPETGQFGCAAFPADREHRRKVSAIVGTKGERDPEAERQWRAGRVKVAAAKLEGKQLARAAEAKLASIIAAHPWTEAEVRRDSPEQRLGWLCDPRRFLAALFDPAAVVWTGGKKQSGHARHAARWRSVLDWQEAPEETVGPMVTPATWQPGTLSRSGANVATAPFVVLDFDEFNGKVPTTPEELRQHLAASLAVIRWLREGLAWQLAAILFTGSKSLHAWFHMLPAATLDQLRNTAPAFGIDAGLIGHPEHPCRLPGWIHPKTGRECRVLWLQREQ
ncbi:MAG: hypothetical protein NTW21_33560 [Verrucomicrobia bacterium]|nr:hypothetical protein [Verrucomicrobiota bacterium]